MSIVDLFSALIISLSANSFMLLSNYSLLIPVAVLFFILGNVLPGVFGKRIEKNKLKICRHGTQTLKVFIVSTVISVIYHIVLAFDGNWLSFAISALVCVIVEAIVFWNGIICVYCTSVQLGLKMRIISIILGPIPIANLIALGKIIAITTREITFEADKEQLDIKRREERICETKYPLLLVHGVFFRDSRYLNYWGRIPETLIKNGATVYYGEQQSAASVANSGEELAERIKSIVNETGCEKVNVIAHSKGGLDMRYAISYCDISPYIASLTTINTPHNGCEFADYLLSKIPVSAQESVANAYNASLRKFGDKAPSFLDAVKDLTSESVSKMNNEMKTPKEVYTQSIGSKLNKAQSGKFPLNFTYPLVKYFDGANDGLVSEKSMKWGENFEFLTTSGERGISHGDMIDLNRENIPGFDVREFYVQLVHNLKNKGL